MASSVDVSVEVLRECLIQEVTLDGQEIYVQPLSMSENLTKLAHKIDFSKDESDDKGKPTSEGDKDAEEDEKSSAPLQPSLWPWDSVRNKLRSALTEITVLHDVLTISRDRRYMTLDYAPHEAQETQKSALLVVARKRALLAAASILTCGVDRMKKSQPQDPNQKFSDFHNELLKLRTKWRLKKVGGNILGDLSYKSAGSQFWQSGSFEVVKAETDSADTVTDSTTAPGQVAPTQSSLRVTIPNELEGVAYIQVAIKYLSEDLDFGSSDRGSRAKRIVASVPSDVHWTRKLEAAQSVIFCKEVFAQLAREAVQVRSQIPHIVVGNQIISHLFPGIHLSISLCHNTENMKQSSSLFQNSDAISKTDHNAVVEHSLHQLLREMHSRNSNLPLPHPVTATLNLPKKRRIAGPNGYTRSMLMEFGNSESMLEQVVQQARYTVIRQRAMEVLDEMAATMQDPQISIHIGSLGSAVETSLRVSISFNGYDAIRTNFSLTIGPEGIKATCKDGQRVSLSYEEDELRDFVLRQVAEHHITSIQTAAKLLAWKVNTSNSRVGVGDLEITGNALGLMLVSPYNDRVLSIRCGPFSGPRVYVKRSPPLNDQVGSTASRAKWSRIYGQFQEIHLSKMEGRNFAQKMETVLACLMSNRTESHFY